MPTINVTEREVSPQFDRGLKVGLIAGLIVLVWVTLLGALSHAGIASTPTYLSSLALGTEALDQDNIGFNGYWLVGTIIHFAIFALIGIVFAAVWPRLRRYGTWTPSILFGIAAYFVVFQIIGRLIEPGLAKALDDVSVFMGFVIAGFYFASRYRRA